MNEQNLANNNLLTIDERIDNIVTSKRWRTPIMLALLAIIFWITISFANQPSQMLSCLFSDLGVKLQSISDSLGIPDAISMPLLDGIYKTLTWVIAVTLPPMAIFFPLFSLLEDCGYLPRIAHNMDSTFRRCQCHGKQCLTMMMGFGCNACAVLASADMIETKRERLLAILTNSFVPCNGRFPTLIAIILMFFAVGGGTLQAAFASLLLTAVIVLGIVMTLVISKLLSKTLLKGMPSDFTIELPSYKRPRIFKVIICSLYERTLFVLYRAMIVAAPAGLLIYIIANVTIGDTTLLTLFTNFLDPFAYYIGVDGVILMAFILGFPANEIVVPIMLMAYMSQGSLLEYESLYQLKDLLVENGWTSLTAVCTMILCLLHFPCGTTCLTIRKVTESRKWTALAFLLPMICGVIICFIVATICRLCGILL